MSTLIVFFTTTTIISIIIINAIATLNTFTSVRCFFEKIVIWNCLKFIFFFITFISVILFYVLFICIFITFLWRYNLLCLFHLIIKYLLLPNQRIMQKLKPLCLFFSLLSMIRFNIIFHLHLRIILQRISKQLLYLLCIIHGIFLSEYLLFEFQRAETSN